MNIKKNCLNEMNFGLKQSTKLHISELKLLKYYLDN